MSSWECICHTLVFGRARGVSVLRRAAVVSVAIMYIVLGAAGRQERVYRDCSAKALQLGASALVR